MDNTIGQLVVLGLLTEREVAFIATAAYNQSLQQPGPVDDLPVRAVLQLLRKEIAIAAIDPTVYAAGMHRGRYYAVSQLLLKVIQADELVQYVLDYRGQAYTERLVEMADGRRVFVMAPDNITIAELEGGMESRLTVIVPVIDYRVDQDALSSRL